MEELSLLVTRAAAGDVAAFERIVRRFQRLACGYAYGLLGDFHLAEDAAQEAFIAAHESLPRLRVAEAFTSWFRQIVYRQCRQLRCARPQGAVAEEVLDEQPADQPAPDRMTENREGNGVSAELAHGAS